MSLYIQKTSASNPICDLSPNLAERFIRGQIQTTLTTLQRLYDNKGMIELIQTIAQCAVETYQTGNKILIAGNGGSAADAQHIAGELVSRFYFDRPALAAVALTTDSSILTAIGNDYGYERLFSRQIQANAVAGDMFIGISTSGNSPNIIQALKECQRIGVTTVGLTGQNGGRMTEDCDYCIRIPSTETPRIQEAHILIGHILCAVIEEQLFGKGF